jgi:hypothetical protein
MDRRSARRLRRAQSSRPQAMARCAAAVHQQLQGDAADGWRRAVSQHAVVDGRRARCAHWCHAIGVQPEELRSRHDEHDPALESAGRCVLDRWQHQSHLLGDWRRLSAVGRREDRPAVAWLWRERSDRSDAGAAACAPGRARLSQCADVLGPVSAARRGRHRHRASIDLVTREQEGADSRLDSRVRRTNGCAAMDLQDRACRGRVRLRNVAARHGRSERQGDGVDDDERR